MEEFDRLVGIMARLRAPGGCPWDREQDHRSIRKYVLEEAYEVAEAIDRGDAHELCGELGDLLLQVVFHAEMAREAGTFDIADVCRAICDKMERRHPHVFGDVRVEGAADVLHNWERIKAGERGPAASAIDGVPRSLPALQRAERLGEKAGRVGFDWPGPEEVLAKVDEERAELGRAIAAGDRAAVEEEIGDLFFAAASLARKLDLEPELALARALDRFEARFRCAEETARASGRPLADRSAEELDRLWRDAKRQLAGAATRRLAGDTKDR
ncbi:MAG TPA: nucleoside triphosphate pyrophosphohydrolase [Candidatus Binatia bacterium]|nr:nucleoside triphosphate pyrophosphohydrolase [Candidatus Binatia bacterium]